jgi:hypothetical protein
MAITCGAILLAISFWIEEQEERAREAAAKGAVNGATEDSVNMAAEHVEVVAAIEVVDVRPDEVSSS